MEIVKFYNGKYGIRKRNFIQRIFNCGGVYKDFKPQIFNWKKQTDLYFKDCLLDTEEEAREWLLKLKNNFVACVIK